MRFIILASIACSAFALDDTDCSLPDKKLSPEAISCNDKPGMETFCKTYASAADTRKVTCFAATTAATEIDKGIKDLIITTCPKTCGYCCKTAERSCGDVPYAKSTVNCTTIDCTAAAWRSLAVQYCPGTCGLCLEQGEAGCKDVLPDCNSQPQMCTSKHLDAFARVNCAKTCKFCSNSVNPNPGAPTLAPGVTAGPGNCVDFDPNCASWRRNGNFCTNSFYRALWPKCPRTCGRC